MKEPVTFIDMWFAKTFNFAAFLSPPIEFINQHKYNHINKNSKYTRTYCHKNRFYKLKHCSLSSSFFSASSRMRNTVLPISLIGKASVIEPV